MGTFGPTAPSWVDRIPTTLFPKGFRNSEGNTRMTNEIEPWPFDDDTIVEVTVKYLRALRMAAGLQIDPETAEIGRFYAHTLDPYDDYPGLPEVYRQVGREYFARSPGSDVWIAFGDLPERTQDALLEKHKSNKCCR